MASWPSAGPAERMRRTARTGDNAAKVRKLAAKGHSAGNIAKLAGMSRASVYRILSDAA